MHAERRCRSFPGRQEIIGCDVREQSARQHVGSVGVVAGTTERDNSCQERNPHVCRVGHDKGSDPGTTVVDDPTTRREPGSAGERQLKAARQAGGPARAPERRLVGMACSYEQYTPLSNGSRLSCGRHARGRKAVERQTERLAGEATQLFLTCERPAASSAC